MKNGRRLLALVVSAAVAASMLALPGISFAAADEEQAGRSGMDEVARQIQDKTKDAFAFRTSKGSKGLSLKSGKSFPKSLDLRNVDGKRYVTPVKFQNPFGTCWGFAAIAAAETSILGSGISEDDGYDWKNLDLSEKHLVNYHVKPITDKDSSQYGEGMYFDESIVKTLQDKFNFGGLPIYATTLFSSGTGPDLEDRALPSGAPAGTPADIYEYHGTNKEIDKYLFGGEWLDYCYSADDDWEIPDELRFTQSYTLKESFMLPSPAGYEPDDPDDDFSDVHYVYNEDGTNAIKDQLNHKRAVEIGFKADQSQPDEETDGIYISRNWAHYTYKPAGANHAVTIIGYDDDYPKENFVKGHQPPENGAWFVKNSWGSGEEEFPNSGAGGWGLPQGLDSVPYDEDAVKKSDLGTGYFWISYYDQSIALPEALDFEESNVGKEYYIDQYDYMPVEEVQTAELDDLACMSNVFTAGQNEMLEQISCQTAAPETKVRYEIYALAPEFDSPLDGIQIISGETEFEYGGFHKIRLPESVLIQKGQSFSIILTEIVPGEEGRESYSINLQLANNEEWAKMNEEACWVKGVLNPKESYVMVDGDWYDMADEKTRDYVFGKLQYIMTFDNFPIKAYSKPTLGYHFKASENPVKLDPRGKNSSKTIRLLLTGSKDVFPESTDIKWEIPEGFQNTFNISVSETNPTRCTISAVKPGTGYIKVTYPGGGTLAVGVEVSNNGGFHGPEYGMAYGEKFLLDELYDIDDELITDYTGLFFRSEDPGIVTINEKGMMKGVGIGETRIIVSDVHGAEGAINVYTYKNEQNLKVKGKKVSVSSDALKAKAQTIAVKKALKIKGAVGKKTYAKMSGPKTISVNKKNGKITVMKGAAKGKYKVKIKVTAAGNKYYNKASSTATAVITIK